MSLFLLVIGRGLRACFIALIPVFVLCYRFGRFFRRKMRAFLLPARQGIFYLVAHRYLVHLLVLTLVLLALIGSWRLGVSAATPIGESSLLFEVVGGVSDETFTDAGLPLRFPVQDKDFIFGLPPIKSGPEIPSTLNDQAMLKIDVSPSGIAVTRSEPEEYIVAAGDTITSIAAKFNISPNTILWENKLGVYTIIRPGQKLIILPTTGISYKVKKGDTVDRIAKTYGISGNEIIQFNNLFDEKSLVPGEVLIVPGGRPYVAPAPPRPVQQPSVIAPSKPPVGAGMYWPTAAQRITQYFSWRHTGVDIAGPKGTPIYAAGDGMVTLTEQRRTGYGWQIMIDHQNGLKTRYGHTSKILVSQGQRVKKGDMIALMGSTGLSTGPHLHFEIYAYGKRVNPLGYVKR